MFYHLCQQSAEFGKTFFIGYLLAILEREKFGPCSLEEFLRGLFQAKNKVFFIDAIKTFCIPLTPIFWPSSTGSHLPFTSCSVHVTRSETWVEGSLAICQKTRLYAMACYSDWSFMQNQIQHGILINSCLNRWSTTANDFI